MIGVHDNQQVVVVRPPRLGTSELDVPFTARIRGERLEACLPVREAHAPHGEVECALSKPIRRVSAGQAADRTLLGVGEGSRRHEQCEDPDDYEESAGANHRSSSCPRFAQAAGHSFLSLARNARARGFGLAADSGHDTAVANVSNGSHRFPAQQSACRGDGVGVLFREIQSTGLLSSGDLLPAPDRSECELDFRDTMTP